MLVMEKQKNKKNQKTTKGNTGFFVWTVSTPFLFSGNIPCTPKVLLEMFITLLKYFHAALHRRQPKNNSSSSETCWLCTGSRSGFSRCSSCLCHALSTSLSLVNLQKCLCTLLNTQHGIPFHKIQLSVLLLPFTEDLYQSTYKKSKQIK